MLLPEHHKPSLPLSIPERVEGWPPGQVRRGESIEEAPHLRQCLRLGKVVVVVLGEKVVSPAHRQKSLAFT